MKRMVFLYFREGGEDEKKGSYSTWEKTTLSKVLLSLLKKKKSQGSFISLSLKSEKKP